jgi:hypothetical protein
MEVHQLLIIATCLILLVNLGFNISLLVKKDKSENYIPLNKNIQNTPLDNEETYTRVAEFIQFPNMENEIIDFNVRITPQILSIKDYKVYIKFEGLNYPIDLIIEKHKVYFIRSDTGDVMNSIIQFRDKLLDSSELNGNNFTIMYKNINGIVQIDLLDKNNVPLNSLKLRDNNNKKITVSFGSKYVTEWRLI